MGGYVWEFPDRLPQDRENNPYMLPWGCLYNEHERGLLCVMLLFYVCVCNHDVFPEFKLFFDLPVDFSMRKNHWGGKLSYNEQQGFYHNQMNISQNLYKS